MSKNFIDKCFKVEGKFKKIARFPVSCQRIKLSQDTQFLIASGLYYPQIHCYEIAQRSNKFKRYFSSQVLNFQILTTDFSKIVFLCADRSLSVHARNGLHFRTFIPVEGRDITYIPCYNDVIVVGSTPTMHRFNMVSGRILAPLSTKANSINSCDYSVHTGLLGCAGAGGIFECHDFRKRGCLRFIDVCSKLGIPEEQLTTFKFFDNGMKIVIGTMSGKILIYDIRSPRRLNPGQHSHSSNIVDIIVPIQQNSTRTQIISSDSNTIKAWEIDGPSPLLTANLPKHAGAINQLCMLPKSHTIILATESPYILSFPLKSLNLAHDSDSFNQGAIGYKQSCHFLINRKKIYKLGLNQYIGTRMVKSFEDSYFITKRLYHSALSLTKGRTVWIEV
jgi:ribosome biogenesis protein ENP2